VKKLRVTLGYLHPWTNDVGFYLAAHSGSYARAGLDVEITIADPLRGDSLAALSRGESDFAVAPTNRLLVRRERGERLISVAAINHRPLESVQTVRATAITRPRELSGRRVAYNPTPRGVAMVRHLIAADGGDPDGVITVDAGVRELTVDDLAAGEADATFGGYWAWDALFGSLAPSQRITWPVDAIGAPAYHSYLLAARGEMLETDPGALGAFLAATRAGFLAAAADSAPACAVLERVIPYFPRAIVARSMALIAPTWTHAGIWGNHRRELLEPYARWLAGNGMLVYPERWESAFSDEFLAAGPGDPQ
jgi:NitT/TauT family transport system substrate-binding protein